MPEANLPIRLPKGTLEAFHARTRHIAGVADIMVADDIDNAVSPGRVCAEILNGRDGGDVIRDAVSGREDFAPVATGAVVEFYVWDPLAAEEVAEDGDVSGERPPGESAVDVCEVVVVAPEVDLLAEAEEVVREIARQGEEQGLQRGASLGLDVL